jgi:nucleolar pre-ribosomal-associated protein 1
MARSHREVYDFGARRYGGYSNRLPFEPRISLIFFWLASPSLSAILRLKSRVVMKLSLLPGPTVPALDALLSHCLVGLCCLEKDLILPAVPIPPGTSSFLPRHTSYSVREGHSTDFRVEVEVWGEVVVSLWRASMTSRSSRRAWDKLTPRILVWNSLMDGEDQVAEWARKEVVWNTTRTV